MVGSPAAALVLAQLWEGEGRFHACGAWMARMAAGRQTWTVGADESIRNVHAGLCLDVNGAGTANGTPLVHWTCNGQASQKWTRT
ncbi:RICIN domain-containing protein [Streptomyces sp. PSKA30]|uniref:RICIN domain-containing protein n=1 Tax=Streptomyces sp. PSKA30 TaxID=2874597 RepID=UPI0035B30F74